MKIGHYFLPFALISQAFAAPHIHALIIEGQNNHNWKSTTPALLTILQDAGLFQVDVLMTTPPKAAIAALSTPNSPNTGW
jgi:hypothetical protein